MRGVLVLLIATIIFLFPSFEHKSPEYYFVAGEKLYQAKEYRKAIGYYTRAIELKPDYIEAYLKRGLSKVEIDSNQSAILDFTKLIELKPNGEIYYLRANSEWSLKDSVSACRDWSEACDLSHNRSCDTKRKFCK